MKESQHVKSHVKKSFFQQSTRLAFWLSKFFLRIFKAHYACDKYTLDSRLSFDITFSIARHLEMILRNLRAFFVHVEKIILRWLQILTCIYSFGHVISEILNFQSRTEAKNGQKYLWKRALECLDFVLSNAHWMKFIRQLEVLYIFFTDS